MICQVFPNANIDKIDNTHFVFNETFYQFLWKAHLIWSGSTLFTLSLRRNSSSIICFLENFNQRMLFYFWYDQKRIKFDPCCLLRLFSSFLFKIIIWFNFSILVPRVLKKFSQKTIQFDSFSLWICQIILIILAKD